METGVKQRLIEFIKSRNLSQSRFEKSAGLSNGFVNNISKGIGADKLQRIISVFPDLNAEWLLTGEGEMVKPAKNPYSQLTEKEIGETITELVAEELMTMYKAGEIYPAEVHDRMIAEKEKRIEELQYEVWKLQQKIEELSR